MELPESPRRSGCATRSGVGAEFAAMLDRWRSAGRSRVPLIMGIVNATPDSFYDGGRFADPAAAIRHGETLAAAGAELLDVGGESTRKNAAEVPADEEMQRVLPVVEVLAGTGTAISIDTMKAPVAEAAIKAGATIVNDIRGLQGDAEMAGVAAAHGAGVIAMHNPGLLGSAKPLAGDPIEACLSFFERSLQIARRAGVGEDRIVLDPGFGFGKSAQQNLQILTRLDELTALGAPILVGTSRKSFIGMATGRDNPDRLAGTLVTSVFAALAGAAILRVHDVAEHVEAMRMAGAILRAAEANAGSAV